MVSLLALFVVILCPLVARGACKLSPDGSTMDCSYQSMEDCPSVNATVTKLIMNHNKVKDFSNSTCSNLTSLVSLDLSFNEMKGDMDLTELIYLGTIDASHNQLSKVLNLPAVVYEAIFSHNLLTDITIREFKRLATLRLGHNLFYKNKEVIHRLAKVLLNVWTLDLSYNNLSDMSNLLMEFHSSELKSLNLAGNGIETFMFPHGGKYSNHFNLNLSHNLLTSVHFSQSLLISYLDLSHNLLTSVDFSQPLTISYLDLSHNLFSFFSNETCETFSQYMTHIDVSWNPLNCSCTFLPYFVSWMKNHSHIFVNLASTNCGPPPFLNIFKTNCDSPRPSSSSSSHLWWLIVPVFLGSGFLVAGFVVIRRRRSGYSQIGDSPRSIFYPSTWINMDCLRSNNVVVDEPINSERSFCDPHIRFEENLVVLCSSKEARWVVEEVTSNLRISSQIVHSKVGGIPCCTSVLVVVSDDKDLKDSTLRKNVACVLGRGGAVDVRLLLKRVPGADLLRRKDVFSKFVADQVLTSSYFVLDPEYPLTCVDELRSWLHVQV